MSDYLLTPLAEDDLLDIARYIANDSPESASRVLNELHQAMTRLARRPFIGHRRPDLAAEPYRFWPVSSYLIIYRPDTTPLRIIRVLHGARDVRSLLEN